LIRPGVATISRFLREVFMRWPSVVTLSLVAISSCLTARADDSPPAAAPPKGSSLQKVAPEDAEAILGRSVTGPDGRNIGRLVDVLVDENGRPQAAVIDFGGFLGVGTRKVAVHWSALRFTPATREHLIRLEMTPDQIKAAPEYNDTDKTAAVVTPSGATPQAR
jgi:hypothetical protein